MEDDLKCKERGCEQREAFKSKGALATHRTRIHQAASNNGKSPVKPTNNSNTLALGLVWKEKGGRMLLADDNGGLWLAKKVDG